MSISKVEFKYKKPNLRYDSTKKVWVGYQIDIRAGKKRHRNSFATRGEAERFVDELRRKRPYNRAGLPAPSNTVITIKELCEARQSGTTERKRREFEKRVFNYFCDLVGPNTAVDKIALSHLRLFVETRKKDLTVRNEPVKPQTVDRELTAIAALLHKASSYFDELENYKAPKIPHPQFRKGRRERVITDAERQAVLDVLREMRPQFAKIFEFASLTGLRHSEIMRLRTTDLDRKARSLKVDRTKTSSVSYISPLTDRMLELLSENVNGYIFTTNGKTPGTFYKYLKRACEKCGIPYGRFTEGGIIFHDNRHSFVSRLGAAGIDIATIQSFSGHSTKEMVMHYSHAGPENRKRAMAVIDGGDRELFWRDIYYKTVSGDLSFEEFLAAVK